MNNFERDVPVRGQLEIHDHFLTNQESSKLIKPSGNIRVMVDSHCVIFSWRDHLGRRFSFPVKYNQSINNFRKGIEATLKFAKEKASNENKNPSVVHNKPEFARGESKTMRSILSGYSGSFMERSQKIEPIEEENEEQPNFP